MDLAIGCGGLTALHEHWKSEEHQLRETWLRLQLGMPLVNENCAKASPWEQKRLQAKVVGLGDVHLALA